MTLFFILLMHIAESNGIIIYIRLKYIIILYSYKIIHEYLFYTITILLLLL